MIRGVVNARNEALVCLRVRGPGGSELDVDAVVDSGFTASLTLPATTVVALGLVRQSGGGAVLADGSVRQFDIYAAEVAWDGGWRPVLVSAVGGKPFWACGCWRGMSCESRWSRVVRWRSPRCLEATSTKKGSATPCVR